MIGGFEEMEPIFGQVMPEPEGSKPLIFHVQGMQNDKSGLAIRVTDFHSNTWEALKPVPALEDMRDVIGIGGSWSEFVDYVTASLKSEYVKLVLEGESKSGGAAHARLISQKAKGFPRISISLGKLVDAAASEAMASIAMELFRAFTKTRKLLRDEQARCCQLSTILHAEQDKNQMLQRQVNTVVFSKRQKCGDNSTSDVTQKSDEDTQTMASMKISNRVVPAYRRAKTRGALLQVSEDEDG